MLFTSQVYAAASGSIGGVTYSRNRGGQYTRTRSIPVNPNTESQGIARENMATAVATWTNTLTDAQRQAWATYAQATPTVNRLGNQLILSGQQMFIRSATARLCAGLAVLANAPVEAGLGDTPQWTTPPTVDNLGAIDGSVTVPGVGTAGDLSIYMSRPVMPSRTAAHETRRFAFVVGPPVASVFAITAQPAPYPVTVGQRVRVTAVYLDDTGRVSAEAFRDYIVAV